MVSLGRRLPPQVALRAATRPVPSPGVNDEAKFFSDEAVEKANQTIQKIHADFMKQNVLVETVPAIPDELQAKAKAMGDKFFPYWTAKRIEDAKFGGIYILLCRRPGHLQIDVDKRTGQKAFLAADREQLIKLMSAQLREKKFDAALLEGVAFVQSALQKNLGKPKTAPKRKRSD